MATISMASRLLYAGAAISLYSALSWIVTSYISLYITYKLYKQNSLLGGREMLIKRVRTILKNSAFIVIICTVSIVEMLRKANDLSYVIGSHIFNYDFASNIEWLLISAMCLGVVTIAIVAYLIGRELEDKYGVSIRDKSQIIYRRGRSAGSSAEGRYQKQDPVGADDRRIG